MKRLTTLVFLLFLFCPLTQAQEIQAEQVMSKEEMQATGLDKMTPEQKQAFDKWLTAFTKRIVSAVRENDSKKDKDLNGYGSLGQKRKIKTVSDKGDIIVLDDESVWDTGLSSYDTFLWSEFNEVMIVEPPVVPDNMKQKFYYMVNLTKGKKVLVTYVGGK